MYKLFGMHIQAVAATSNYIYYLSHKPALRGKGSSLTVRKGERNLQACLRNLKMIEQSVDW